MALHLSPGRRPRALLSFGAGLAAGLALGAAEAQAQTTPAHSVAGQPNAGLTPSPTRPKPLTIWLDKPASAGRLPVLYIDGQRQDSTALARYKPEDIASIEVLKGEATRRVTNGLGPAEAQRGVLFITTKAAEHTPVVNAFKQQINKLAESEPAPSPHPQAAVPSTVRYAAWPPVPSPLYYVDGQRADSTALKNMSPGDITALDILKDPAAEKLTPGAAGHGVVLITTKQNATNPAVLAFNRQAQQLRSQALDASPQPGAATQSPRHQQPADVRYYLNGKLTTWEQLTQLDQHTVTHVRTLRGRQATDYTGDPTASEVFVIEAQQ